MLPRLQKISLTDFRKDACRWVRWVEEEGGHLWIARHGRVKVAVVPLYEAQMLDKVLSWNEEAHLAQMEREYSRWKAAKAIQRAEHARRKADGWDKPWVRHFDPD